MQTCAVVGANWGDEGKGKIVDVLAREADIVVRFQGGGNAGHTIINDYGKFVLHTLPSGAFYSHVTNVIGPGVAVNMQELLDECGDLVERGVPVPRLRISDRAQLILPYHILLDRCEEERLGDGSFGSTQKGIAPFYGDKYLKVGIRIADLFCEKTLRRKLDAALTTKNVLLQHLYAQPPVDAGALVPALLELRQRIAPFVCDTTALLRQAIHEGKSIVFEGQLGALRDPDHGIYPFVTSSSPLAGFATVGAGVGPADVGRVVAVTKAYSSCVGAGPFVTELSGRDGDELRERGGDCGEYGATTGRPRRVGWFDAVATRYGCALQGASELALSMIDVLGYHDTIPLCVAYGIRGSRTQQFPGTTDLAAAEPIYESMPGWKCDVSACRRFDDLPPAARAYVGRVEELAGVPVRYVSVGSHRQALIDRRAS
jgi:adenylosuccinate synthase